MERHHKGYLDGLANLTYWQRLLLIKTLGFGRRGLRSLLLRLCRLCFFLFQFLGSFAELATHRQPYSVARMQEMDVNMRHGIITLHLVGLGDGIDCLPLLHNVDVVLAAMEHLCLVAYHNGGGARSLRPSRKSNQDNYQY